MVGREGESQVEEDLLDLNTSGSVATSDAER